MRPPSATSTPPGFLGALARFLSNFRWAFMPLGLLALVAVGVHAAADTLDDRLLWGVDALDSAFDRWVGRWAWTQGLVDLLTLEGRTRLARALALGWELAADVLLGLPLLGYREVEEPERDPWRVWRAPAAPGWRELLRRCVERPVPWRWVRPLCTALVCLAGACAVGRLVQGTVYLSARGLLGEGLSDGLARVLALGMLGGVLATLGWRAVLRALEHADALSVGVNPRVLGRWLVGSALVVPLALAAWLDATPLLSFLR